MSEPRALVLRGPGSNCDHETAYALDRAGARAERVHVNRLLDGSRRLRDYDLAVIPGGFTYADDIAAGRVIANKLRFALAEDLLSFVASGKPLLGICNGFQILLELGLLQPLEGRAASLTFNDSGRFECRWTALRVHSESRCQFLSGLDEIVRYPVAHGEGKLIASDEGLARLLGEQRVAFSYHGAAPIGYPDNPNGSRQHIAGICDVTGRILGLMPHPERALARRSEPAIMAMGQRLFGNLVSVARTSR